MIDRAQPAHLRRQTVVAGFAAAFALQPHGAVLLEATLQAA